MAYYPPLNRVVLYGGSGAGVTQNAFAWDGSAWTEAALPAGVTAVGTLECVGADQCLLRAAGVPTGLIAWMGDSWYPAPAPPTNGGVSCLALWCLGVGSAGSPTVPAAATYEWTNP